MIHLIKRFFGSLLAKAPNVNERHWVAQHLTHQELDLWYTQSRADQRHAIEVAQRLPDDVEPWMLAAALLHDVGKREASLNTVERSLATVTIYALGKKRVRSWAWRSGWKGRFGRYSDHGAIGALLLAETGSDQRVITWAKIHASKTTTTEIAVAQAQQLRVADHI